MNNVVTQPPHQPPSSVQPQPAPPIIQAPPQPFWQLVTVAVMTGCLTLGGVAVSSYFGWITSKETNNAKEQASCIQRVDKLEDSFRTEGKNFIVSIGRFTTELRDTSKEMSSFYPAATEISDKARALLFSVPSQLNKTTIDLAESFADLAYAKDSSSENEAAKKITDLQRKWDQDFDEAMNSFESRRKNCTLESGPNKG